jgi:hypothetical protein
MAPLLLLLALAAQAAPQPDWRPIGVASNGRQTSYDPASVARAGAVTRVRVRFADQGSYSLSTVELRCAALEARIVGLVSYDANGTEVSRNEMTTPFRAVAIGGFLQTLASEICSAAQSPARPQ